MMDSNDAEKEMAMKTGQGINTVRINGEIKHISDLDPVTLSMEWTKLKNENNELYRCIREANSGWLAGGNSPADWRSPPGWQDSCHWWQKC